MTRWDDVGDLGRLLDPESLTALLRDGGIPATSAVPDHLRLKAGVNALVGLRIETASGRQPGYVRTYADPAQAGRAAQKWQRMRVDATTSGPGVRLLPGGSSVLFLFPNDARVRRLRLLAGRPRRLARVLADLEDFPQGRLGLGRTTLEVLRYKPERRLVACARLVVDEEPRTVVFRLRADGAGPELSMIIRRLHAALGARVPRPLGLLFDGALVAEDVVPGTVLAAAVAADDADPGAAAEVIAALHSSGITLPDQLEASDILSRALAGLDLLTAVDPSIVPALRELRSSLVAALPPPRPPVSLHGDLHLDQIILGSSGPVVLDFERAATGPAGHDLGTLVAHLRAEG
ncbi:MAG TPA: phosphotransferase, partial [Acidimicrobiales bacterium]|nr:phosphotransferase [Acidimicrobiales bacterium]